MRGAQETMVTYNIAIFGIITLLLDYYRSSAVCTECLSVPVSIIVAVLFILLSLYGLIRKGISVSQLTQVCISILAIATYIQMLQ